MKLSDARENYYFFTGKLSDVNRQLCFAGIAVVWIFVIKGSNGTYTLPGTFLFPLGSFIFSLTIDLIHYIVSSASWGLFHRKKEKSDIGEDADFEAPAWINWGPSFCFWLKVISTLIGYTSFLMIFWR